MITKLDYNEIEEGEELPIYKILLIGDSTVGKTSLILQYCQGQFNSYGISTIGVDTKIKYVKYNDKKIGLEIWDTAGQERFRALAKNFYQGADGIILMYDLTQKKTFNNIKHWFNDIIDNIEINKVAIIIVGNKSDLSSRQITKESCDKFCEQYNLKSIETSCLKNTNVDETFNFLIEKIIKENNYKNSYGSFSIINKTNKSKAKKCCF
jgi:Ras-related protein Rab-8A